jgi:hypothetical protein
MNSRFRLSTLLNTNFTMQFPLVSASKVKHVVSAFRG